MRIQSFFLCAITTFLSFSIQAQEETIFLTNPSFEDLPRHSNAPRGWLDCGFEGESDVDIHPSGTFAVIKPPQHGNTYLGMVVRDNDTWERIAQPLSTPMQAGQCYEFSIYLARSETYISVSKLTDERANYNTAAKLRIYGGMGTCERSDMLAETNLIIHTRWIEYQFKFEPEKDYNHIIFEAFYNTPTLFPYNGNILLDNASGLKMVPCEEEEIAEETPEEDPVVSPPVVVKKDPTPPQQDPTPQVNTPPPPQNTTPAVTNPNAKEVIESVAFNEIKKEEIKTGTIIRTNQVYFEADKSDIKQISFKTLDQLVEFLNNNPGLRIEIGGHTNGLPQDWYCDQLSSNRAKAVVRYLVKKGIAGQRLESKGYGKRQLIASDETLEGRKKNQRVEIKILDLGNG